MPSEYTGSCLHGDWYPDDVSAQEKLPLPQKSPAGLFFWMHIPYPAFLPRTENPRVAGSIPALGIHFESDN